VVFTAVRGAGTRRPVSSIARAAEAPLRALPPRDPWMDAHWHICRRRETRGGDLSKDDRTVSCPFVPPRLKPGRIGNQHEWSVGQVGDGKAV
jgi:hypothetical protein